MQQLKSNNNVNRELHYEEMKLVISQNSKYQKSYQVESVIGINLNFLQISEHFIISNKRQGMVNFNGVKISFIITVTNNLLLMQSVFIVVFFLRMARMPATGLHRKLIVQNVQFKGFDASYIQMLKTTSLIQLSFSCHLLNLYVMVSFA